MGGATGGLGTWGGLQPTQFFFPSYTRTEKNRKTEYWCVMILSLHRAPLITHHGLILWHKLTRIILVDRTQYIPGDWKYHITGGEDSRDPCSLQSCSGFVEDQSWLLLIRRDECDASPECGQQERIWPRTQHARVRGVAGGSENRGAHRPVQVGSDWEKKRGMGLWRFQHRLDPRISDWHCGA